MPTCHVSRTSLRVPVGTLALVLVATACTDVGPGSTYTPPPATLLSALIVSNPVAGAPSAAGPANDTLVYASLRPGSITDPNAEGLVITTRRTGAHAAGALVRRGMDPVALAAAVGDTLDVRISLTGDTAVLRFFALVPPHRRPVVLRSEPQSLDEAVPLSTAPLVVFSEPIDPATLSGVSLRHDPGDLPVPGTFAFADSAHLTGRFTPSELLASDVNYRILVPQSVADLDGETLEAPVTVSFLSETVLGPPPSALILSDPAGTLAWASMPPASAVGERVLIRRRKTGWEVTAEIQNGGFGPTPIPVAAGETLDFHIQGGADGGGLAFSAVVPLRRAPVVVRTEPSAGRRDVALDATLRVVLSEPIHGAALTAPSVQVSRDGAPVEGALTFGDPAHVTIAFSPAEWLVAGAEHQLLVTGAVTDLDGEALETAVTVGFATPGVVLPPGPPLAFVRDGQIYRVDSDGTGVVRLSDGPGDAYPAWSPDGGRLAFSRLRGGPPETAWQSDIYVMDADGSNVVRRTTDGDNTAPSWSPDGIRIAFARSVYGYGILDVYVMAADDDGTSPIDVTNEPGYEIYPAWSPDGTRIALVSDWVLYDFTADIFTMAPDGSQRTRLTDGFVGFDGRPCWGLPEWGCDPLLQHFQPAWSPDGQRLALVTCRYAFVECSASTVSVMNADGTGLVQLATTIGYARPTWSPDGQTIAFGAFGSL